ncbi:MAG: hypothetical protein RLZZ234_72 [Candidatus Parcubacteria bacterium]|jgi:hypothetical protein
MFDLPLMHVTYHKLGSIFVTVFACFLLPFFTHAATLKLTPETGVFQVGGTWTARVVVNTAGKPINAAEATLSYNPKEIQVLGISKASSIFNLWTIEPTFSNASGKVSFGGGSPSGYTGGAGTVMSVTFKALTPGTPKVNFGNGSVLAADGQGTNVLSGMVGGTYTVSAASESPKAEPAPEYVAPSNAPGMPKVESSTHSDPTKWYTSTTAKLSWALPGGVTAVRTLLDARSSTVPTVVYEPAIREREITDLQGENYFHIQFKNADGWGKVAHYRLAVDTARPESFTIALDETATASPKKRLIFTAKDADSGIEKYAVQIDGGERVMWNDDTKKGLYELPLLGPGDHTVVVEAFDYAGNGIVSSLSFAVQAFEAPKFTDYPTEITERIIPVIKGETRPDARVMMRVMKMGGEATTPTFEGEVIADASGVFTYVPEGRLARGTYEVTARAVTRDGLESAISEPVRIAVQESAVARVGSSLITILSVAIPLIALSVLLVLLLLYATHHTRRLRARLMKEVTGAEQTLADEMSAVVGDLQAHIDELREGKQGKLSKAEVMLLNGVAREVENAAARVAKALAEVERTIKRR